MNRIGIAFVLVGSLAYAQEEVNPTQTTYPLPEPQIARLPVEWREPVRKLVKLNATAIDGVTKGTDENVRYQVVTGLSTKAEGQPVLLADLEHEASARIRSRIVTSMRVYFGTHPATHEMLRKMAVSDPDPKVSIDCVDVLRRIQAEELVKLVRQRLDTAKKSEGPEAVNMLAEAQERWISLKLGVMLPAFLRKPPGVFSVKPAGQSIRVLAFGDYGTGSAAQKDLSAVMLRTHKKAAFDFGVTMGDNFYTTGMESPEDARWQTQWEQLYGPLGLTFYATLGNHDWGQSDSPAAEILYAAKSGNWRMPAPYYSYTAGPVQFFAVDTNEISDREMMWLGKALAESKAKWKVVYGHHHIYSATRLDNAVTAVRLLPVLKAGHADLYLCGHDHNIQVLKPEDGVHFVVAGGGGAGVYVTKPYERSIFKKDSHGFAVVEASEERLTVKLIDFNGDQVYEHLITKW